MLASFVGARKPLDTFDIPMLAHRIGTGEDELRAFLEVEARSRGFDREGRPVMLNEPHVFYRNIKDPDVKRQAVALGLAYPKWGTKPYPKSEDARYDWLRQAMQLDYDAALMSCSIGLSQVLVENFSSVGYSSPEAMWQAFMDDEQEHVEAMVRFIIVNGIDDDLRAHRWSTVARVYNGPGYKKNNYHDKMAAAFKKFTGIEDVEWAPDDEREGPGALDKEELRAIQKQLRALGYVEVGRADGIWGTKFRAGVLAFRADNGLPITASLDDQFRAALAIGKPRDIAGARKETTVADLRADGSRTVAAADKAEATGAVVALGGGLAAVKGVSENIESVQGLLDQLTPLMDTLKTLGPWCLVALGGFVVWQAWKAKEARLKDHQTGKNAGEP